MEIVEVTTSMSDWFSTFLLVMVIIVAVVIVASVVAALGGAVGSGLLLTYALDLIKGEK